MKQSKFNPKRLKTRIFLLIEILVIFQLILIILCINLSGTVNELDNNAISILNNTVISENNGIKNQMMKLSNLKLYTNMFKNQIIKIKKENNISTSSVVNNKKYSEKFMKDTSYILLKSLNEIGATGSFIILNNGERMDSKKCIYLRDLDYKNISIDNSDIIAKIGPKNIISHMKINKSKTLINTIDLRKDDNFFWKPIQGAKKHKDLNISNLGYWSPTFKLKKGDNIITYTVPLLDENNNTYGVLGMEISTEYLKNCFSNNIICKDEKSSSYIGIQREKNKYETQLIEGRYYKSLFPIKSKVQIYGNKKNNILNIARCNELETESNLINFLNLDLYGKKNIFNKEKWITGIVLNKEHLYSSSNRLKNSLLVAIGLALLFSIIGTIISTEILLNPIDKLMNKLRKAKTLENVKLGRTNIKEIDELAEGIERLSRDVFENASRVSNVIRMSDMPLGVLEYNKNQNNVFCTKKLREIADFDDNIEGDYIPRYVYLREIEKFKKKVKKEVSEKNIYSLTIDNENKRYIKIIESDNSKGSKLYIFLDITTDILEKKKIIYDRDHDTLTNLLNRNAFELYIKNIIKNGKYKTGVLTIWDVDDLKYINDKYGHDVGDKYIFKFGLMLEKLKKEGALVSRMAGDEFLLFFPGKIEVEEICQKIENYHKEFLNTKIELPGGKMDFISVSAGIAILGKDTNDYEQLIKYADYAMYEVKNKTKGGINRFNKENYIRDYVITNGTEELNFILEQENINYAFQPIVDMKTKKIFAYEALMRPKSELLKNPADLIRVASDQLKLNKVESITWFKALESFFNKIGDNKEVRVFINSLPNQCLSEEEFEILDKKYGEKLKQVVMEITENAKVNIGHQKTKSDWCAKYQIDIALDDYGTGYNSGAMLIYSEFNFVKIDRSIIKNIDKKSSIKILVKGIVGYCHKNGIKVIGEGIETKEEFEELLKLKVDYGQGYFLAKPSFELIKEIKIDL